MFALLGLGKILVDAILEDRGNSELPRDGFSVGDLSVVGD